MRVIATQLGYYGNERQRPGKEFTLLKPQDFSARWMKKVNVEVQAAPAPVVEEQPEPVETRKPKKRSASKVI